VRRAAKIDNNQPAIIAEFERLGCSVKSTAAMGDGFPDLLVWCNGHHLVEVKNKGGRLTQAQVKFIGTWPGRTHVVRNKAEVMALVQQWERGGAS